MLVGAKTGYEAYHNVVITDEAIDAIVDMAVRHMPDRRLPDKAFDLMDEAAALAGKRLTDSEETGTDGHVTRDTVELVVADMTKGPRSRRARRLPFEELNPAEFGE